MKRKDFIQISAMGFGSLLLPKSSLFGNTVDHSQLLDSGMDILQKKQLADVALNAAKSKGASYADIRINRYLNQIVATREKRVENVANIESFGVGVRVIANGCWGFAATNDVTKEGVAKTAERAVAVAKANAKFSDPLQLAPQKGYGEVSWKTPIEKNAFEVPIKEKIDLLLNVNNEGLKNGGNFMSSSIFMVNEQKYFASTDGSYIDQDIHRIWPNFTITKIDKATSKFETRNALCAPMGMGYEYLMPQETEKLKSGNLILYKNRYDILEDARQAASQVAEKLQAKSIEPGKYDLILDPSHLFLTIHESVGHPTELDRVLGYEANFAGTSFLTLDKWQSKKFNFGNKLVNFMADKTQTNGLATIGYDDDGVQCGNWDIIKDGILVNYQTTRDQAHILGLKASQGCSYAESWSAVPF
ncbi:MAG: TldD/PmbA family protein, partial [Pedobacter sp.]|nr:TldD/PmbA family protein [Chitinophagaceae bacterium]